MNCPECGHHIVEHGLDACYGLLDNGEVCTCTKNAVGIGKHFSDQLAAYKAEAMAARKLWDAAPLYTRDLLSVYKAARAENERHEDPNLAARVKDE